MPTDSIKQRKKTRQKKKPTAKRKRLPAWSPLVFLCCGLSLILLGSTYILYRRTILSFAVAPSIVYTTQYQAPEPVEIVIPSAKIDLPIISAQIRDGIWETSDTAATHLATSARPGEPSNIIIYGHNLDRLMGRLTLVKIDDLITLKNAKKENHVYKVVSVSRVKPNDTQVVLPTSTEELTVYTCTGFLDSLRFVVKATPVAVE